MTPRPPDTRTDLIEAALRCFAAHGYDGTSTRMIAQEAGRPLSLIGHHFGGKEGLYLEVFRYLTAHTFATLTEGGERLPLDRAEAIRLFREHILALYLEACSDASVLGDQVLLGRQLVLSEMRNPRPEILALLRTRFQPWVNLVKACIKVLRPDLTEDEVTLLGMSIMGQISSRSLTQGVSTAIWGNPKLDAAQSAKLLADFSLRGLGVHVD